MLTNSLKAFLEKFVNLLMVMPKEMDVSYISTLLLHLTLHYELVEIIFMGTTEIMLEIKIQIIIDESMVEAFQEK